MDDFTRTVKQRFPRIKDLRSRIDSSRDLNFVQEFLSETDFLGGGMDWRLLKKAFEKLPSITQEATISKYWYDIRRLAGKIQNEASWVNGRTDDGGSGVQNSTP